MKRQQLQPYKPQLRLVFDRMCALVEKRTVELAVMRKQRDDALAAARINAVCLAIIVVAACLCLWIQA